MTIANKPFSIPNKRRRRRTNLVKTFLNFESTLNEYTNDKNTTTLLNDVKIDLVGLDEEFNSDKSLLNKFNKKLNSEHLNNLLQNENSYLFNLIKTSSKTLNQNLTPSQILTINLYTLRRVLFLYINAYIKNIKNIDPEQPHAYRGEKLLCLHILKNAIKFSINIDTESIKSKNEAQAWLLWTKESDIDDNLFSFFNICQLLELDSTKIRKLTQKILGVQKLMEVRTIKDVIKRLNKDLDC
jgi:hypothetical protein